MEKLFNKVELTNELSKNDIIELLNSDGELLFKKADEVRKKHIGNLIHLRALIEFSNICKRNCAYCGLRCQNSNINRYSLTKNEILQTAKHAIDLGYKTIVLQSGEGDTTNIKALGEALLEIKKYDVAITLSIGELSYENYEYLKKCGADRFLLRIETTNEQLYNNLHPNMSFENRKNCLYNIKKSGYEVGTGVLVGLPNQSIESLAEDILFFKSINADMIGVGPFIPHNDTPLKDELAGELNLALKVMAITRLLLPDINIPATTAMEVIEKNGRLKALKAGANVIMVNVTDENVRKNYEIYAGKCSVDYSKIKEDLLSIGRNISYSKGFRGEK
ncbi:MAG: [FeFe] hydrogenase H-cluster radical SAM maturase HydE [Candidatus Gastranaerophilales bacterium]